MNDSRGFYTSRCFETFTLEGLTMLTERITPPLIENAGRMAGMPMGPLEVMDSVGVDTGLKISRAYRAEDPEERKPRTRQEQIMAWLVEENGRTWRRRTAKAFMTMMRAGSGSGCGRDCFPTAGHPGANDADPEELKRRLLTIQALEAARCYEENVITDPRDADVGAILGWGFAPFTGGPLSMIDTMGAAAFVAQCDALAGKYGERFQPNRGLREMANSGETFYGRFAKRRAA